MVFGVGINDMDSKVQSYTAWHSIIRRCYSDVYQKSKPTYIGVKVCDDWKTLSNFHAWYVDNYVEGWQVDKDLISNFGRLYSPENCCFLPNEINCALSLGSNKNGLPTGVSYIASKKKYCAQYSRNDNGIRKGVHVLYSKDPEECFLAYKSAKEAYLAELAEKYRALLSQAAYNALVNFSIQP